MEVPEDAKEPNPVLPKSTASDTPQAAAEVPATNPAVSNETQSTPVSAKPTVPASAVAGKTVAAEPEKSAAPAAKSATPPAAKPAPKPEGPKPVPWDSALVTRLRSQYGSGLREASTYIGQNYLIVDRSIIHEILLTLCREEQFDYCVDITAVHYPKREQPFDLIYVLYSFPRNQRIRVKTLLNEGERVRTAVPVWPTANWLEREVFDMFGIGFEGHPDLKRILLPDGWKGHPLRKDYPILKQDKEWVQINLGIESGQ